MTTLVELHSIVAGEGTIVLVSELLNEPECPCRARWPLTTADMTQPIADVSRALRHLGRQGLPRPEDGTLWIHLDSKMSHYAKVLPGSIFTYQGFIGEIIWQKADSSEWPLRRQGRGPPLRPIGGCIVADYAGPSTPHW